MSGSKSLDESALDLLCILEDYVESSGMSEEEEGAFWKTLHERANEKTRIN